MSNIKAKLPLEKIDDFRWRLPKSYKSGMRVDGIIYATLSVLETMMEEQALQQVANVATLPGIVKASLAMPDIHWGYGFPIGGVAATRVKDGVISPGGIGFDANCGVRLLTTTLSEKDLRPQLELLVARLFNFIPSGIGVSGKIKLAPGELKKVMRKGARWSVDQGYGWREDLDHIEEHGALEYADPDRVSQQAIKRGLDQLGTIGSGNHFVEVQVVDEIYLEREADIMGLAKGNITILIHTGSRGFGHQIAADYINVMIKSLRKYGIELPDKQLACAPINSPEGEDYWAALACAANYAWANRQCITHWVRESFEQVFKASAEKLGIRVVYDVAHNIAKHEKYEVDGREELLCVHRKGAVRAFPPGHSSLPERYRQIGQPIPIPGDMGRYSYICVGTKQAAKETFSCTCHGAGRLMSRSQAKREVNAGELLALLAAKGIIVKASSQETITEEAPVAYKDVTEVVDVMDGAGIAKKVAKLRPIGVIKG